MKRVIEIILTVVIIILFIISIPYILNLIHEGVIWGYYLALLEILILLGSLIYQYNKEVREDKKG